MPEFVLGFKAYAESHDVGDAITDEYTLVHGEVVEQATTKGLLRYYVRSNIVHFIPAS